MLAQSVIPLYQSATVRTPPQLLHGGAATFNLSFQSMRLIDTYAPVLANTTPAVL